MASVDTRINAKAAALKAKEYYTEVVDDRNAEITLEEIELQDTPNDEKFWNVTLSIKKNVSDYNLISQGIRELFQYKLFKVDARTGDVLSMKIREAP